MEWPTNEMKFEKKNVPIVLKTEMCTFTSIWLNDVHSRTNLLSTYSVACKSTIKYYKSLESDRLELKTYFIDMML